MAELFGAYHQGMISWQIALLSFLIAVLLSSMISKTYQFTYEGLSWSKSLTQALVLGSVVTCMMMMAIGDNVARGIGVFGTLAIIRFRTNLRDPRDIIFVFSALGTGVAAGAQSFAVGILGTLTFCLLAIGMKWGNIGSLRQHNGSIRFQLAPGSESLEQVRGLLGSGTRSFSLVAMNELAQGTLIDYTYQLRLRNIDKAEQLLLELGKVEGIQGLKFISQEGSVEL
ncbi:MAG: DUF4956 domain-containing protein [Candidatus Alcyoniella australis]|nr:DUF4956 domain-containing protein [Candidatus Alcyoniella australis]